MHTSHIYIYIYIYIYATCIQRGHFDQNCTGLWIHNKYIWVHLFMHLFISDVLIISRHFSQCLENRCYLQQLPLGSTFKKLVWVGKGISSFYSMHLMFDLLGTIIFVFLKKKIKPSTLGEKKNFENAFNSILYCSKNCKCFLFGKQTNKQSKVNIYPNSLQYPLRTPGASAVNSSGCVSKVLVLF